MNNLSEVKFGDLVLKGDQIMQIQSLMEDLLESGADVQLIVAGYDLALNIDGRVESFTVGGFEAVLKRLNKLNAELQKHFGQIGGRIED